MSMREIVSAASHIRRRALSENLAVFQTSFVMSAPQCDREV